MESPLCRAWLIRGVCLASQLLQAQYTTTSQLVASRPKNLYDYEPPKSARTMLMPISTNLQMVTHASQKVDRTMPLRLDLIHISYMLSFTRRLLLYLYLPHALTRKFFITLSSGIYYPCWRLCGCPPRVGVVVWLEW